MEWTTAALKGAGEHRGGRRWMNCLTSPAEERRWDCGGVEPRTAAQALCENAGTPSDRTIRNVFTKERWPGFNFPRSLTRV